MDHPSGRALLQFRNEVGVRFQLYNSLFTSLPFHRIEKTGILLSLLSNNCEEGYKKKLSPSTIVQEFFDKQTTYSKPDERNDLLFRFVQYIERQVVLFDALEDAAFRSVHDINGVGTLKHLESEVLQGKKEDVLAAKLNDFAVRLVLTAHPTQFYPGPVLGIINDLSKALADNNTNLINTYLQQLGKTPFFKKKKPTPYDEAVSLIWYLENVFYPAAGRIISSLKSQFPDAMHNDNPVIRMGFWPGGDRDGNPFVTSDITLQVANALRGGIIKCYYMDVRRLRRRLTFEGVDVLLQELENKLYSNLFIPGYKTNLSKEEILFTLQQVRDIIIHQHNGLFLHMVSNLINKIGVFGLHFASLDIRQDSSIHGKFYQELAEKTTTLPAGYLSMSDDEKINALADLSAQETSAVITDPILQDTVQSVTAIRAIQQYNGVEVCNRHAAGVMKTLYTHPAYKAHLKRRGNQQTIMLGFSDGTKDGGYLMANWCIYKAKEELTRISRENEIDVVFFDGRGGPPSRGGGKTHKFYASMGHNISNKEIQLTIQGQTVSSNFGTIDAAQFNIEQLLNAGITNDLFNNRDTTFSETEEELLLELAQEGFNAYKALKDHPYLADYLLQVSPLRFYSETNIGSRPAKRGGASGLSLKDLRAIPFAGSWSQLKQNVTGYFGVGSALQTMEKKGKLLQLQKLYHQSLFFRTLLDNCEMAMMKSFFPLTAFLAQHKQFGEIWQMIYDEYELTKQYLFKITGNNELMADYPVEQASIQMRERIVLPLVTIQQYALTRIRELDEQGAPAAMKETYEKLAMRCSFGIINAGRNSA